MYIQLQLYTAAYQIHAITCKTTDPTSFLRSLGLFKISQSTMSFIRPFTPSTLITNLQRSHFRTFHTSLRLQASPPVRGGPARREDRLSFFPFLFIFLIGTGFFAWTVKQREGITPRPKNQQTLPADDYPNKIRRSS